MKSLFWVHIQTQSFPLQTLISTFPGHFAGLAQDCSNSIANALELLQSCAAKPPICPLRSTYPSGYPSQLPGEYTTTHTELEPTAYKSAFTSTHLPLHQEKQNSLKCLAQGNNESTYRQGIEARTWPRSWSPVKHSPQDQLVTNE